MADYQPLFVDFAGRPVVIFGGGAVGERKAAYFMGARVTVVSRDFTPGLEAMPGVTLVRRDVAKEDVLGLIKDAFLVIAATGDPALNREIAWAAGEAGKLVNSAEGGSDVILPAKVQRGPITIAVSTGGRSPAMARFIRRRLEESLGGELADMVRLQGELRDALKRNVRSQDEREKLLWQVLDDADVWEALAKSYDGAKRLAFTQLGLKE